MYYIMGLAVNLNLRLNKLWVTINIIFMRGEYNLKNFVCNYLIKYIFFFFFFLVIGYFIKSLNMNISKALGFASGAALYDLLLYTYRRFLKKKCS